MSEHGLQQTDETTFDFFTYADELVRQEQIIRDGATNDVELAVLLTQLVDRANETFNEYGLIKTEVSLDEEGLENCRIALPQDGKVYFNPVELEEDESAFNTEYCGLALRKEKFSRVFSGLNRLQIVHKLFVEGDTITTEFYREDYKQYAILPLEDSKYIQFAHS